MNSKATLAVIEQIEILTSLVSADDLHKTGRVDCISSDLAINLDVTSHTDLLYFVSYKDILESDP